MQKINSNRSNRSLRRSETRRRTVEQARRNPSGHQGAVESDVAPTTPPDNGPDSQAGKTSDEIDPADELTPG